MYCATMGVCCVFNRCIVSGNVRCLYGNVMACNVYMGMCCFFKGMYVVPMRMCYVFMGMYYLW